MSGLDFSVSSDFWFVGQLYSDDHSSWIHPHLLAVSLYVFLLVSCLSYTFQWLESTSESLETTLVAKILKANHSYRWGQLPIGDDLGNQLPLSVTIGMMNHLLAQDLTNRDAGESKMGGNPIALSPLPAPRAPCNPKRQLNNACRARSREPFQVLLGSGFHHQHHQHLICMPPFHS